MRAHTPPFTAKTAKQLYDETSAIAAAQDAKHAMTADEREAKLRTVAHYIYHAKLLMDEVFSEERKRSNDALDAMAREGQRLGLYDHSGTSAEVAYLRKCGIGDVAETATTVASQHPMAAEVLRDEYERGDGATGV